MIDLMLGTPCTILLNVPAVADVYGDIQPGSDESAVRVKAMCHVKPRSGQDRLAPDSMLTDRWMLFFAADTPIEADSVVLLDDGTRITITAPPQRFRLGGTAQVHHIEVEGETAR